MCLFSINVVIKPGDIGSSTPEETDQQSDDPNPHHRFKNVGRRTQIDLDLSTYSDLSEVISWISGLRKILRPCSG